MDELYHVTGRISHDIIFLLETTKKNHLGDSKNYKLIATTNFWNQQKKLKIDGDPSVVGKIRNIKQLNFTLE